MRITPPSSLIRINHSVSQLCVSITNYFTKLLSSTSHAKRLTKKCIVCRECERKRGELRFDQSYVRTDDVFEKNNYHDVDMDRRKEKYDV